MNQKLTLPELSAALIRVFEGLRLTAYADAGGVPTLGFGHTLGVKLGDTCTEEQAEAWLAEDSAPLFAAVQGKPILQAAALVSFGYNCGLGALKRVLAGQAHPEDFIRAKGKVLPGLVARRKLEKCLMEVGQ